MTDNDQLNEVKDQDIREQAETGKAESPSEKLYTADEVGKLLSVTRKEARQKAYDAAKKEAMQEYQQQMQQQQMSQPAQEGQPIPQAIPQQAPMQPPAMPQMPSQAYPGPQGMQPSYQMAAQPSQMPDAWRDELRKIALEQQEEAKRMAAGEYLANQFANKVAEGKAKYPDWDQKVGTLINRIDKMPEIAFLANSVDNTADVLYSLGQNSGKVASLRMLNATDHEWAQEEMRQLSNSIRANQQASATPQINAPLSQIAPSTAGTDNGKQTIEDLRKQPWLKG